MQPTLEFFKQEYVFLREGIPNTHILFHMGLYKGIWDITKVLLAVSYVKVMVPISFLAQLQPFCKIISFEHFWVQLS